MDSLMFNQVLRAEGFDLDGLFRVVATPSGVPTVWLAFIGTWKDSPSAPAARRAIGSLTQVARATLQGMEQSGQLAAVDIRPTAKLLQSHDNLDGAERKLWERRCKQMGPFLDHRVVCDVLARKHGIGKLVERALQAGDGSRATVYRLWSLLCQHGFETSSLHPRFDRCGAPGVLRPVTADRVKAGAKTTSDNLGNAAPFDQRGVTAEDRVKILLHARLLSKPGLSMRDLYLRLIERVYVSKYQDTTAGRVAVMPVRGTFPNQRQVRHILDSGVHRLDRILRATTQGHYDRNLRGLRGRAYDNVAGPGHLYGIDSTIADIHLRSSINLAWPIGRPIVYVVVDFWSTAIVGFHVCLSGPSWATAKLALFSTFSAPQLMSELWGYERINSLNPAPTAPFEFVCDRGEYLSAGARETCLSLGINFAFNPAYRPDLKGLVE